MRTLALAALLAAACGSSAAADRATVIGTVDGAPLLVHNAAAIVLRANTVDVLISNLADGCSANAANLRGKQVLSLGIAALSGPPLDAGVFAVYDEQSGAIPQGTVVFADYHSSSSACADSTPPNTLGASGKVTVTHLGLGAGGGVTGSFDLLLQNGDHLKGVFDAPICGDRPDAGVDAGCH